MYFTEFKTQDRRTYYEDPMCDVQHPSEDSMEKESSGKETDTLDRDKLETSKRETNSFMQDDDVRAYTDDEKAFLVVLTNTIKVYGYQLSEEYLLRLIKYNGMDVYIPEYVKMLKENDCNFFHTIIDLGDSSLQRFLINKEKSVYQFPPNETDTLMVIRDGE